MVSKAREPQMSTDMLLLSAMDAQG